MTLALPARAKLNLDLHVAGRRPDGFHDLATTMQSIELHDLLLIEEADQTSLAVEGFEGVEVTGGPTNSVLKAQAALEQAAGRNLPARFDLCKRIPPGSGMGGASSDAAAALRGLSALFRLNVELGPIAAQVGADVPFFLQGGRARAGGRGERLTPIPDHSEWYAIAWPRIELSTPAVYRAWDEVQGEGRNELLRAAQKVDPRVERFAEQLGAEWAMTGSGSAFFRRCESEQQAVAAVRALTGRDAWTSVTRSIGRWA